MKIKLTHLLHIFYIKTNIAEFTAARNSRLVLWGIKVTNFRIHSIVELMSLILTVNFKSNKLKVLSCLPAV